MPQATEYPLNSDPVETDQVLGIDNPDDPANWSIQRFSIAAINADIINALHEQGIYPSELVFQTEGDSFAPVIIATGTPSVLWTFSDGSTSTSLTPNISFGSAGTRKQRLKVTPWSAVTRINVGYYGEDGGAGDIEMIAQQNVSAVANLQLVAPTLVDFCGCHCPIVSLDFHDFLMLDTVEMYACSQFTEVILNNTPELKRACFENSPVGFLDFSTSPLMEDVRGSQCHLREIRWGTSGQHLWHMCVRNNGDYMVDGSTWPAMTNFPVLRDMWIENNAITGDMVTNSTVLGNLWMEDNPLNSLDVSNGFPSGSHYVHAWNGLLTSVIFDNCPGLDDLDLHNNLLPQAEVDRILASLDSQGATNGVVNLAGTGNAFPSSAGMSSIVVLEGKGWTCTTNTASVLAMTSATIGTDGNTWTFVFSEAVQFGAGGNAGLSVTMTTAGVIGLTYVSGSGSNTLIYTGDTTVDNGDTVASGLNYTQPGDGIENNSGDDLATFTDATVINQSSQGAPTNDYFEFTTNDVTWGGHVTATGTITWDFGDGTQYIGNNPGARNFGSAATRTHRVTFSDPDSLTYLDLNDNNADSVIALELNNFAYLNFLHIYLCQITALDISGCPSFHDLHLNGNAYSAAVGDKILSDLVAAGVTGGELYQESPLHSEGGQAEADRQTLLDRGWSVYW